MWLVNIQTEKMAVSSLSFSIPQLVRNYNLSEWSLFNTNEQSTGLSSSSLIDCFRLFFKPVNASGILFL